MGTLTWVTVLEIPALAERVDNVPSMDQYEAFLHDDGDAADEA